MNQKLYKNKILDVFNPLIFHQKYWTKKRLKLIKIELAKIKIPFLTRSFLGLRSPLG